ncbi:type II toxin-antitoxin system RelE/ParE family toxin [Litorimonas haliclonae]|uniref:type II toxin-antitoxin system RelE/ParE family toxin n=1 Tax=Litorimonas haliclonae TaxID=2081977 RepID=UPI0039EF8D4F
MIKTIRHKGLREYWKSGTARRLNADWVPKIRRILNALDRAEAPEDMNIPGYYFHLLKGKEANRYSVRVSGNWRITFEFDGNDATILDLEDYH